MSNNVRHNNSSAVDRRRFVSHLSTGISSAALASLADPMLFAQDIGSKRTGSHQGPVMAPKAKRVIYLFQSGGPSQLDLFDYKPNLKELRGHESSRLHPQGTATDRDDVRTNDIPRGLIGLSVCSARTKRSVGQRSDAASGESCG